MKQKSFEKLLKEEIRVDRLTPLQFSGILRAHAKYEIQSEQLRKHSVVRGAEPSKRISLEAGRYEVIQIYPQKQKLATEPLGNEALGKAGALEVLNIKTGQLLSVEGCGFLFGKDLNSGEIRCFNIENVSGESREGALH